MATVIVDDSSLQVDSQPMSVGLSEGRHSQPLGLIYIHQMNRVNSRNDFVMMTEQKQCPSDIIIIIIIIIIILIFCTLGSKDPEG